MTFYGFIGFLLIAPAFAADGPVIQIPLGKIQGTYNTSEHGRKFEAFAKVPYAQAPIGKLRFEPPHEVLPWTGVLAATENAPNCMGHNPFSKNAYYGLEDCLYLRIYTPNHQPSKLQPVIMWLHPGPLSFKLIDYYGPQYLMDRDVVFIDVNFRMGPLGFLSTEDDVVPGNMGLKDQSMALKWISKNIESFGGDPNKVMIVGGSGGGMCVNYHYLSPLSRGLFHSGMSLSGSGASIYLQRANSLENAKTLAKLVNCSNDQASEMVDCLKTKPAETLSSALSQFPSWNGFQFYSPFGVVVEKSSENAFLDQSPIEIMKTGTIYDVPWLAGTTHGDGMYPMGVIFLDHEKMKILNDTWETTGLSIFRLDEIVDKNQQSEVAKAIKKEYFGTQDISVETKDLAHTMSEHKVIKIYSEKSAKLMAKRKRTPVWYYNYEYRSKGSYSTLYTQTNLDFGCVHQDDTLLVLQSPGIQDSVDTPNDLAMQGNLLDIWVSMAENGKPAIGNVTWSPVNSSNDNLQYLSITGPGNFSFVEDSNFANRLFWDSLPLKDSII